MVQSLIISMLFMLVGLSLFVGTFPPSPKQVKGVFSEYQKMMKFKEHMMDQYANKDPAEMVEAMEKQQRERLKAFAKSRGDNPQIDDDAQLAGVQRAAAAVAQPQTDPQVAHQIFQLQSELARLNQRVVELENELASKRARR